MLHGCETGDAKITKGYRLPARHVIHAVGSGLARRQARAKTRLLASCYRRAIELCQTHALCLGGLSRDFHRRLSFPAPIARRGIAVSTTVEALAAAPAVRRVIFCCFSDDSARLHAQAMAEFGSPCAD